MTHVPAPGRSWVTDTNLCEVCDVQCRVCKVHCIVFSVQCRVCSVKCIVCRRKTLGLSYGPSVSLNTLLGNRQQAAMYSSGQCAGCGSRVECSIVCSSVCNCSNQGVVQSELLKLIFFPYLHFFWDIDLAGKTWKYNIFEVATKPCKSLISPKCVLFHSFDRFYNIFHWQHCYGSIVNISFKTRCDNRGIETGLLAICT